MSDEDEYSEREAAIRRDQEKLQRQVIALSKKLYELDRELEQIALQRSATAVLRRLNKGEG